MMLSWLTYMLLVSSMLALAAWTAERALCLKAKSTRLLWPSAMAASLVIPATGYLASVWFPDLGARAASYGLLDLTLSARWQPALEGVIAPGRQEDWSIAVLTGWMFLSASHVGALLYSRWRLRRESSTWYRTEVLRTSVRISPGTGPATIGVIRPFIVLPKWTLDLPEAQQDLILNHEIEHLRARDGLFALIGIGFTALTPWNPVMWWMLARLRLAQEIDCDRKLIAAGVPVRGYIELLIEAGRRGHLHRLVPGFTSPRNTFRRRVLQMTHTPRTGSSIQASVVGALALAVAVLACDTRVPGLAGPVSDVETSDDAIAALTLASDELRAALANWSHSSSGAPPEWSTDGRWVKLRLDEGAGSQDWVLEAETWVLTSLVGGEPDWVLSP